MAASNPAGEEWTAGENCFSKLLPRSLNRPILKKGTIVDSTIISRRLPTKNKEKKRIRMHIRSRRATHGTLAIKPHVGVDKDSGLAG